MKNSMLLGILEADSIEKAEIKETLEKKASE